ncbi:fumarate hydratase, partial [Myxococcota bacterium]|nr:fumarate hydratase [Myxococcota bacterium]
MSDFQYQPVLTYGPDETPYRKLTGDHVSVVELEGVPILKVEPEALTRLAREAVADVSFLLRPGHLAQLGQILKDPEASDNDRFVALELLKNAN